MVERADPASGGIGATMDDRQWPLGRLRSALSRASSTARSPARRSRVDEGDGALRRARASICRRSCWPPTSCAAAAVGDVVTYVVNRNINFTNVCIKHCGFCAFSRDHREEEGYFLPIEEVVRRAQGGVGSRRDRGLRAGRPAAEDGRQLYVDL